MAAEERDFDDFYYAIPEEVFPRGTQYFTDTFELAVSKCAPETLCFDHLLISFWVYRSDDWRAVSIREQIMENHNYNSSNMLMNIWPELDLPNAANLVEVVASRIKQAMI